MDNLNGCYYLFDCMEVICELPGYPINFIKADAFKNDRDAVRFGANYEAMVILYEFENGEQKSCKVLYDPTGFLKGRTETMKEIELTKEQAEKLLQELQRDPDAWTNYSPILIECEGQPIIMSNTNLLPDNFSFPKVKLLLTDKVSQKTFENAFDEKLTPVLVSNKKKADVYSYVSLQVDNSKIAGIERLSQYDKAVLNAVNTLYSESGRDTFTMNQLYKVLVGSKTTTVEENSLADLRDSLNRLGSIRITIDASEEARAFGYEVALFNGYLCPFDYTLLKTFSGEEVECINILRKPVLFDYAGQKNQIARIPMSCLNTPGNKNREKIAVQDYLQDRIVAMKNNKKLSRMILFENVYAIVEFGKQEAIKKRKLRAFIQSTLSHWVETGLIQGFEFIKEGNAFKKIKVEFDIKI